MPLVIGASLGPYQIVSPLGAGGMGEVYRARDTKLNRDVAIKILPETFANDPDRLARFTREAQTLAALNHPNIAHIHGLEESGGVRALVMELVEGEDLAQRIARGPMPLDEALPIARQIADALEAAHERHIIHRDLKPANIKVRADGTVKVLDFGLAKAIEGSGGSGRSGGPGGLSLSPTIMSPAAMTGAGIILGTAAYMSPEQARGKPVDKRADIWAFGCVLFEMVTGTQAFAGETISDLLAAVLTKECDLSGVPPRLRGLLRRCLEKDPAKRLRDIGDMSLLLDDPPAASTEITRRRPLPWFVAALAVVIAAAAIAIGAWTRTSSGPAPTTRLVIALPEGQELTDHAAISPDGKTIAYTAREGGSEPHLFLRDLNAFEAREVTASSGATQPFFSPDSGWIGFFAQGQLQ
jgi:serine/threonine protein kinase